MPVSDSPSEGFCEVCQDICFSQVEEIFKLSVVF